MRRENRHCAPFAHLEGNFAHDRAEEPALRGDLDTKVERAEKVSDGMVFPSACRADYDKFAPLPAPAVANCLLKVVCILLGDLYDVVESALQRIAVANDGARLTTGAPAVCVCGAVAADYAPRRIEHLARHCAFAGKGPCCENDGFPLQGKTLKSLDANGEVVLRDDLYVGAGGYLDVGYGRPLCVAEHDAP